MKNVAPVISTAPANWRSRKNPRSSSGSATLQLGRDERDEEHRGEHEQQLDPRRPEAVARRLDQRVGQRREERRDEQLTAHVDLPRDRAARARHEPDHDRERDDADRRVRDEHRLPPERSR